MKTMMKSLIAVLLLIVSGAVVMAADNAPIQDEPLPSEVKKLIGMKIPPKVVGKRAGAIPDFIAAQSRLTDWQIGKGNTRAVLGIDAGMVSAKWPVFIVSAGYSDRTEEILDIRLLPEKMLVWGYANGEIIPGKGEYVFAVGCLHVNSEGKPDTERRLIVGLEDTSFERDGYSTRIGCAWEIDPQNGHIKSIPTVNIICPIVGGED